MKIRRASEADYPALRRLYLDVRQQDFVWERSETISLKDFDEDTAGEDIYLAMLDGQTAGFVSVWAPDCFIHHLYVSSSCRKRGVGRALVDHVRQIYTARPLTLKCVQENERALAFYEHHGWQRIASSEYEAVPYYLLQLK